MNENIATDDLLNYDLWYKWLINGKIQKYGYILVNQNLIYPRFSSRRKCY